MCSPVTLTEQEREQMTDAVAETLVAWDSGEDATAVRILLTQTMEQIITARLADQRAAIAADITAQADREQQKGLTAHAHGHWRGLLYAARIAGERRRERR